MPAVRDRYVINPLDAKTYTIFNRLDSSMHMLLINTAVNNGTNVQVIIAEVTKGLPKKRAYVEFVKETLSFCWYASDWNQIANTVTEIFDQLHRGVDVDNPVELAAMFGCILLGDTTSWPTRNYTDLN